MYFQLTINEYISGGRFLSVKYHLSSPVLYMVGHHSFRFVKDTFVSDGLLQFIQYSVELKEKCLPLLRNINTKLLLETKPIIYHSWRSKV